MAMEPAAAGRVLSKGSGAVRATGREPGDVRAAHARYGARRFVFIVCISGDRIYSNCYMLI